MKSTKKISRKKLLKEPDEFITTAGKLIAFSTRYQRQLIIGASLFILLVVGFAGYRYFSDRAEKRAFTLLERNLSDYRSTAAREGAEKALKSVDAAFTDLIEDYSSREGGKLARMIYAGLCFSGNNPEKAISLYKEALDDFSDDPPIRSLIQNGLGHAHEVGGDLETAAGYFRSIVDEPGALLKDEALFQLARIYRQLGKADESREAYTRITADHPGSIYAEIAREEIAGTGKDSNAS